MRSELILSSGVQYSRESVEFRLAMCAYANKNEYRRQYDFWLSEVLLDIFFAASAKSVTEDSRNRCMNRLGDERSRLYNLLSLAGGKKESAVERRKREEEHLSAQASYATALAGLGNFGSFEQLEAAITALNETIRENQGGNSNGADSGTAINSD